MGALARGLSRGAVPAGLPSCTFPTARSAWLSPAGGFNISLEPGFSVSRCAPVAGCDDTGGIMLGEGCPPLCPSVSRLGVPRWRGPACLWLMPALVGRPPPAGCAGCWPTMECTQVGRPAALRSACAYTGRSTTFLILQPSTLHTGAPDRSKLRVQARSPPTTSTTAQWPTYGAEESTALSGAPLAAATTSRCGLAAQARRLPAVWACSCLLVLPCSGRPNQASVLVGRLSRMPPQPCSLAPSRPAIAERV